MAQVPAAELSGAPIAALATAPGAAAIAVVRLSGLGVFTLARSFTAGLPETLPPRGLVRAFVLALDGTPLDEVLVAAFPAPASYTGEDVLEIHCHGGIAVARAVEARVLAAGLRRAQAGEFTARAVAHGKLDLLDAEALAALLRADDAHGLKEARAVRRAGPEVRALCAKARTALAEARGLADHPIETAGQPASWRENAVALRAELLALLDRGTVDGALRDGLTVAILGPPNAGKSSLFNALSHEPRAIVDALPGTTRDALQAPLWLRGQRVTLIDTAGLREATGIEQQGVERALAVAKQSALRIWVEDVSAPPASPPAGLAWDLRIEAKADLVAHVTRAAAATKALRVSVEDGRGLAELEAWLGSRTDRATGGLSARQQRALGVAAEALETIERLPDDLAADRLGVAADALARLTGEAATSIDAAEIYAQFCIGK